jgi:hypothetical protein
MCFCKFRYSVILRNFIFKDTDNINTICRGFNMKQVLLSLQHWHVDWIHISQNRDRRRASMYKIHIILVP